MSCAEIGLGWGRDHSERKYCQSWEQYLLTDKKEVERKKNISEEDGMVL